MTQSHTISTGGVRPAGRGGLRAAALGLALATLAILQPDGALALDEAELVKAAQAEGEVTWYTSATDNVAAGVATAFKEKYGIEVRFLRLSSNNVMQRYATEAEAGSIVADLVIAGGSAQAFAEDGIAKGWVQPIGEAGLPVIADGTFPAEFNRGSTALAQIQPWILVWNTDLLKPEEAPKGWTDVLDPRFKGQIMLPNPGVSDAYTEFWYLLEQHYGSEFLNKVNAMEPRRYDAGVQALQALSAGEGTVMIPLTVPAVEGLRAKGAPVDSVMPDLTTGVELQLILTASDRSPNPNAGQLLANYLLSPEGNKVLNTEPGAISVYDSSSFPAEYVPPDPAAGSRKEGIAKALGF